MTFSMSHTHMMCNICPICHHCLMELFYAYLDYMTVYTDKLNRMCRLSCKLILLLLLLLLLDYIILTIMLHGPEKTCFDLSGSFLGFFHDSEVHFICDVMGFSLFLYVCCLKEHIAFLL